MPFPLVVNLTAGLYLRTSKDVYSCNFSCDNKYFKLLGTGIPRLVPTCFSLTLCFVVYSIFLLETVQTVLSGADLYYWFAADVGNTERLSEPFVSFLELPIMGAMVSFSVQLFFLYRISSLSAISKRRSRWLCCVICVVTFSQKSQNDFIILL